jgi:hypothetical protein
VLEGWDTAGKGGIVRRLGWALDPRSFKVHPIAAPDEHERAQHYLQRFWSGLPERGQIVTFDRSWYGRVLVERVEGFATKQEWRRAYREINEFERVLVDAGIRLVPVVGLPDRDRGHDGGNLDQSRAMVPNPIQQQALQPDRCAHDPHQSLRQARIAGASSDRSRHSQGG